ncbi:hypothetical protein B0A50_08579 [Salinomyces thailandicus]|uniref:Phosphatidate phosphatase APP1 catalytic domain-containing protein n=1 Tax=Salinomyces thailandicus TaxID=706561 RepID=A0A4U0TJ99_9PEZI|nr:hypothetical protein B0A50_08579 [Salinomyces thailandica]
MAGSTSHPGLGAQALNSRSQNENRRNILSDAEGDVNSVLNFLGSDLPSYVASGIPQFFHGLPTGDSVKSSLGIGDSALAAQPTNVLNIDPYANWTDQGWNVRFHGNVYKQPNTSTDTLNDLADSLFIYGTDLKDLPDSQQAQARNLTAEIFVVQQDNVEVNTIHIEPSDSQGSSGQPGGGGGTQATGGEQDVTLPYNTTLEGDFDAFVPIDQNGLMSGNETQEIQRLNTHVQGATLGNSTAYLVPPQGLTVISDIDDILRVTKIYEPEQGLLNSFARPFTAWMNMPSIYSNWSTSLPNLHFHYLTTTPEQVTRNYMQFIYATYPGGSFDTRPLNFSDISATLSIRKFLLNKIFETYPQRKFVLVADTSNSDVMRAYPQMAKQFKGQVQCILLRNTSATDDGDRFPYDTSGFEDLDQSMYMFFRTPDDLTGLDLGAGQCYNTSVAQNLTFGYQGLPLGLGDTAPVNGSANGNTGSAAAPGASAGFGMTFAMGLGVVMWLTL